MKSLKIVVMSLFHHHLLMALHNADVVVVEPDMFEEIQERFVFRARPRYNHCEILLTETAPIMDEMNTPQCGKWRNPFTKKLLSPPMRHFKYGTSFVN